MPDTLGSQKLPLTAPSPIPPTTTQRSKSQTIPSSNWEDPTRLCHSDLRPPSAGPLGRSPAPLFCSTQAVWGKRGAAEGIPCRPSLFSSFWFGKRACLGQHPLIGLVHCPFPKARKGRVSPFRAAPATDILGASVCRSSFPNYENLPLWLQLLLCGRSQGAMGTGTRPGLDLEGRGITQVNRKSGRVQVTLGSFKGAQHHQPASQGGVARLIRKKPAGD